MNVFGLTKFIANVVSPIAEMLKAPCTGFRARTHDAQIITLEIGCLLEKRNIEIFPNNLITYLSMILDLKERMQLLLVNKNWDKLVKRPLTLLLPFNGDAAPVQDMIKFAIARMLKAPAQVECPLEKRNIEILPNELITHLSMFLDPKDRMKLLSVNKNWNKLVKRPLTLLLPFEGDAALVQDMIKFAVEANLKIQYFERLYHNVHAEECSDMVFEGRVVCLPLLCLAAANDYLPLVNTLLSMNVDVDIEAKGSFNNWTALHFAIVARNRNVVNALLTHGANIHAMDRKGRKALSFATPDYLISFLRIKFGSKTLLIKGT